MSGKRILVVEDEPSIRQIFKRMLENLGHNVETAEAANTAMLYFRKKEFDLVITDKTMPPGMNGIELAAWIASYCEHNNRNKPVIVLITAELEVEEPQPHITKVLHKPITSKDLHKLEKLL